MTVATEHSHSAASVMHSARLAPYALPPSLPAPFAFAAAAALTVFAITFFAVPRAANISFALLAIFGVGVAGYDLMRNRGMLAAFVRQHWLLMLSMAGLPIAVALHQMVAERRFPDVPYTYLRLALFTPIAWGLLRAGRGALRSLPWALAVSAIVSAVWIQMLDAGVRPDHVGYSNVIPFGNLSLLMGALALMGFDCQHVRRHPFSALLLLAGGAAGLYASVLSGTRGGWLAVPLLAMLLVAATRAPRKRDIYSWPRRARRASET